MRQAQGIFIPSLYLREINFCLSSQSFYPADVTIAKVYYRYWMARNVSALYRRHFRVPSSFHLIALYTSHLEKVGLAYVSFEFRGLDD